MISKVSLIIPTYNRGEVLANTIRMAASQDYPNYEVIVVDQSEVVPDAVRVAAEEAGPLLRYIRLQHPNLPAARNVGVRAATGDIIVFIDDDVVIEKDHVSRHAAHYTQPGVGGVAGLALPNRPISMKDAAQWYGDLLGAGRPVREGEVVPVASAIGCNMSYRKQAIIDAGMFDENFVGMGCGEDTDLSMRVKHCGYQLLFDSNNKLVHLAASSGGCGIRDPVRTAAINRQRVELSAYLAVKNWRSIGPRAVWSVVWGSYRGVALNSSTLRAGVRTVWRSHIDWSAMTIRITKRIIALGQRSASLSDVAGSRY